MARLWTRCKELAFGPKQSSHYGSYKGVTSKFILKKITLAAGGRAGSEVSQSRSREMSENRNGMMATCEPNLVLSVL